MKKICTLFIIIIALFANICAQTSFEVHRTDESGRNDLGVISDAQEFTLDTNYDEEFNFYFTVKNTTTNEVSARISKKVTVVQGSTNTICSGATATNEFPVCATGDTTDIFVLLAEEASKPAKLNFFQGNKGGNSYLVLNVYNDSNPRDSISFKIKVSGPELVSANNITTTNFSVYPNPATNYFTIAYDFTPNSYVEVYNVLGKVVAKINPNSGSNFVIDCSKWEKGYYFCRLYKNNKVEKTVKLIVTR